MDYRRFFEEAIDQLHAEKRYRVFANLERIVGRFPRATWRTNGTAREIIVWCSNDYLGMGHHPDVIKAMCDTANSTGSGAGGSTPSTGDTEHFWTRVVPGKLYGGLSTGRASAQIHSQKCSAQSNRRLCDKSA